MSEPPVLIDGVRVLHYCSLGSEARPTGRRTIFLGDDRLDLNRVRGLVIGENLVDQGLMLLHCDTTWEALAGFPYATIADALESANAAYTALNSQWVPFRKPTSDELREIEHARLELQEWAREQGDQSGEA